jgi:hypothetical protein
MIQEVNDWNEETRKREDAIALAMWKWTQGLITEEEYENVVEPDKGARTRCPTEWGGHGDNFSMFFCTNCNKEFRFNEKGKQRGSIIDMSRTKLLKKL